MGKRRYDGIWVYDNLLGVSGESFVSTRDFGADPSESAANNSSAISKAINFADDKNLAVYTPAGNYTINTKIQIPSNMKFFGDGKFATVFLQSALNTPSIMLELESGTEYQKIQDVGVRINLESVGGSTQVGIKAIGARRYSIVENSVDNLGQSVDDYSGIGILLDMSSVTNAYSFLIANNLVLGCTYGLWSKGPITSSIIENNHFKTKNGIRIDRDNVQGGTTAIVGNIIRDNRLQSHSSATFTTGNGIDFGQSDSGLGFTYAAGNFIDGNYIEQFENGILFRSNAKNNFVGSTYWDNPVNQIVDLNIDKDGYSSFDPQNFQLSIKDQIVEFTGNGTKHIDKKTDEAAYGGRTITQEFTGNGETIVTLGNYEVRCDGNGSNRTGAVLSGASAIQNQRVVLVGATLDTVSLSTTGLVLNGGAGVTLGINSTNVARIEFERDATLGVWQEVTRTVRA